MPTKKKEPDTLDLWNRVGKTNPEFTKKVDKGKYKFTSIDAYSQIRAATEEWGVCGTGWGWEKPQYEIIDLHDTPLVKLDLRLWYGGDREFNFVDVVSSMKLFSKAGAIDDEVYKKLLTDAVTKALSYLGFSADVFLGKFDDNRYVEERTKEEAAKADPDAAALARIKELFQIAGMTWNEYKERHGDPRELTVIQKNTEISTLNVLVKDIATLKGLCQSIGWKYQDDLVNNYGNPIDQGEKKRSEVIEAVRALATEALNKDASK
jgi:hypothetical protein